MLFCIFSAIVLLICFVVNELGNNLEITACEMQARGKSNDDAAG